MKTDPLDPWRDLIEERTGVRFSRPRTWVLRSCLDKRMQRREMSSYGEYLYFILHDRRGEEEWPKLLRLLLNQQTHFFRHAAAFSALRQRVLFELLGTKARLGERFVRMWSAGCATGQEAYSLAMCALERFDALTWRVEILGTDIDEGALEVARKGIYQTGELDFLGAEHRLRFLEEVAEPVDAYRICGELRRTVRFAAINLATESSWELEPQDVVFCQNVLLYFEPAKRHEVVKRLTRNVAVGGYLFLEPNEVPEMKLPEIEVEPGSGGLVWRRIR